MRTTVLMYLEDRKWLVDVHLKHCGIHVYPEDFVIAILYGNEYTPEKVELFKKNHYRCIPSVFTADADGDLRYRPSESVNAGKLRKKTKSERKANCL